MRVELLGGEEAAAALDTACDSTHRGRAVTYRHSISDAPGPRTARHRKPAAPRERKEASIEKSCTQHNCQKPLQLPRAPCCLDPLRSAPTEASVKKLLGERKRWKVQGEEGQRAHRDPTIGGTKGSSLGGCSVRPFSILSKQVSQRRQKSSGSSGRRRWRRGGRRRGRSGQRNRVRLDVVQDAHGLHAHGSRCRRVARVLLDANLREAVRGWRDERQRRRRR